MNKVAITLLFLLLTSPFQVQAFWGIIQKIAKITRNTRALNSKEIKRLSKLSSEIKGTEKVGRELGRLNLPDEVMEDAFIRIAVHQNKIKHTDAVGMFSRLSKTPGFRSTLRKVIGNSEAVSKGHLNELKIADAASLNRFKIIAIGRKFSDGLKKAPTDIDILLHKKNCLYAIEAKNYSKTTKIPLDKYRADLDSLIQYQKKSLRKVIPIFTMTAKPTDLRLLKTLQRVAETKGVQLIFGQPKEQIEKIKLLGEIL